MSVCEYVVCCLCVQCKSSHAGGVNLIIRSVGCGDVMIKKVCGEERDISCQLNQEIELTSCFF